MSEMVERVARAIYEDYAAKSPSAHLPWDALEPFSRQLAISNARAAMAAMSEHTEAMVEYGSIAMMYEPDSLFGRRQAAAAYRAMISAALAEQAR